MGYQGKIAPLPMGNGGLQTDDPQNKVPHTNLIRAINIQYYNGLLEKEAGSSRFTSDPLPSGVVSTFDWWPNDITQRLISVCRNGRVYRHTLGALPAVEITPSDSSPGTLVADEQLIKMVAGGSEVTNNPRKLFIFSQSIPQVIDGDGITRRKLTKPALDWTGNNQPFFGTIHRSRMAAFGNRNNPHTVYLSAATDQEDFQSGNAIILPCYSGEGEKLISGYVYKGTLFVWKYPSGLYQLIDTDPDSTNWYFARINSELGMSSPHGIDGIINDVWMANGNGFISSVTATLAYGNLKTGEILYALRNENFLREEIAQQGSGNRQCIYYSDKKLFLTTYQSAGGIRNDRMLRIDLTTEQSPKVSWSDKDQANCLALRKDDRGVKRPIYGSEDGNIYLMDRPDRNVGGSTPYTFEIQTPHLDLGFLDSTIADQNKLFEFLEIDFEPTGQFNLDVEVHIDGKYMKTVSFDLSGSSNLDSFILDQDRLDPEALPQNRRPLGLSGRRISLKATQSGLDENVRLAGFNIYFRLSAQQQSSGGKQ